MKGRVARLLAATARCAMTNQASSATATLHTPVSDAGRLRRLAGCMLHQSA